MYREIGFAKDLHLCLSVNHQDLSFDGMPAIPSFINNYKSGWKAKAVIKSSLSRFNRTDTSSSIPTLDVPPSLDSPAVPSVIDITDDQSSLDFDGGQPDEFEDDILDKSSEPHSSRPSNVSSASPPAKLEISLPPELRIDWFADKFSGVPPNATKAKADTNPKVAANAGVNHLDQHTRDTLAGKIKDDQGLVETLEDVLARHVDSNVTSFDFFFSALLIVAYPSPPVLYPFLVYISSFRYSLSTFASAYTRMYPSRKCHPQTTSL